MKRSLVTLSVVALAVAFSATAQAQATRTWVSGVGDDANPCSRTAPCKTFAGAISKTAAGGEISVLDPGGFGAVTITKAITINGDGTLAGILSAGTNGVIVNAGVNDRVVLRNISINGVGTGLNGVRYLAGKSLTLDNVNISGVTTRGIDVSLTAGGDLFVRGGSITNANVGVSVGSTGGACLATFERVAIQGNVNGLEARVGGRVMASNSIISGNTSNGVLASGSSAIMNIEGSQIAFNELSGVNVTVSGGIVRLSNNQIYNNTAGVTIAAGGTVQTTGNNRIFANGSTTAPNGGAITVQ
jgi:hypothetical protein